MVVMNPFDAGGYSLAEMTEAINILPNVYTRLGQMGLFRFEGVTQRSVIIEQAEGVLNLLPTVPLGGPATVANRDTRSMRSFTVPWIPHDDVITPQDIQGVRGFGVADAADPLATVMERKLTRMRVKHAQTREYMEVNALRGIVKDGAGTTLYDYFSEFGLAQLAVDFVLGTAGTQVQAKVRDVLRHVETELKGETMTGVLALVSPGVLRQADRACQGRGGLQVLLVHRRPAAPRGHAPALSLRRHRLRGVQRHRHALDGRHRDADPGRRGHRLPARHARHLRHARRAGEPDRDRQHGRPADLRPADLAAGRQRHRGEDRGLDPAGQQAAAAGRAHPLEQLSRFAARHTPQSRREARGQDSSAGRRYDASGLQDASGLAGRTERASASRRKSRGFPRCGAPWKTSSGNCSLPYPVASAKGTPSARSASATGVDRSRPRFTSRIAKSSG